MSEYRNYDVMEVMTSPHYAKHVSAMTGEDLYGKGEIAEELAVRDMEIERLALERDSDKRQANYFHEQNSALNTKVVNLQSQVTFLRESLEKIADYEHESNEWEAVDFFWQCRELAREALAATEPKGAENMSRPICTVGKPAEKVTRTLQSGRTASVWNHAYDHPDATKRCIDDDHEDYEYHCPHCNQIKIVEGSDY